MNEVLAKLQIPDFKPLPPLWGGHRQTIAAFLWPQKPYEESGSFHQIRLPDQDHLVIYEDVPENWKPTGEISVLVHGLTGCYQSSYLQRLARKLVDSGHRVFRVNLRGCGPGFDLAQSPYHSGRSEDICQVLHWLSQNHPTASISLLGFSLGANISLKLAGEGEYPKQLKKVVAVSPPLNLAACTAKMAQGTNRLFSCFFTQRLIKDVQKKERNLPIEARTQFPKKMSLRDFDDIYTAPKSGFSNAAEYYSRCSSNQFVPNIKVSTLVLYAKDDPVIDGEDFSLISSLSNIDLVVTDQGGHVAFLAKPEPKTDIFWMDRLILRWLQSV